MKLTRYNHDVYRVLDDTGAIAFLALRLTNGKWGAFDKNEAKLTKQTFDNPGQVRGWLENRDPLIEVLR